MDLNVVRQSLQLWWKATVVCGVAALAFSCTPVQQGAAVGTGLGAGAGALIGHAAGDSGEGALIGAGVGAITGALAADYHEKYVARPRPVYVYDEPRYYGQPYYRHYYYDRPRYSDYHRYYYGPCCR